MKLFKNATIYTSQDVLVNYDFIVDNGKFVKIAPEIISDSIPSFDLDSKIVIPGFIDIHVHGGYNYDTMDADVQNLAKWQKDLTKEGVTSFLPTTITSSEQNLINALESAKFAQANNNSGAEILGVHFEGPYIDVERKGAQPEEFIKIPSWTDFEKYNNVSKGLIKKISYSLTNDVNYEFTKKLVENKIVASLAHSNSCYDTITKGSEYGLSSMTHTFNAMTGLQHRLPGAICAALDNDKLYTELIVDNIHVASPVVRVFVKSKGYDKVIIITDAMRAKQSGQVYTELGGQEVEIVDNGTKAVLRGTDTLAGSVISMIDSFKNILEITDCSINQAILMTSTNAALSLGIDNKGRIKEGYDADFIVLDQDFNLEKTFCKNN